MHENKTLLSESEIRDLLDLNAEDAVPDSMNELINNIKYDPNAKKKLREFLKNAGYQGVKLEDRLAYLREHYYVSPSDLDDTVSETPESTSEPEQESASSPFADTLTVIINKIENECYKSIIPAREEEFSSVAVRLTEGNVIETGVLKIRWKGSEPLNNKLVFLMKKVGNQVLAVGHLQDADGEADRYWAVFDDEHGIFHEKFENETQVRIVVVTQNQKYYSCVSELDYSRLGTELEKPLCIDFGTSNTTVGSYGIRTTDEVEIVKFVDITTEPHNTNAAMIPTIVYVEDCSDPDNIQYLFGYEALKRIEQDEHYEFKASAFFEIKRWMTSPSSKEVLKDNNNNSVEVERKQIIKAYLDYVIHKSELFFGKHFQNIHFSAPVKLKSLFLQTLRSLYDNEKTVLSESESIDEAFAIVYNQIVNIVDSEKKSIQDKHILIMDCGGGTTDLANCSFTYTHNEGYSDELTYTTRFENGNSNFGGNNITYRIMQLLKIKIAAGLDETIVSDANLLIDKTEDEILNTIEQSRNNNAVTYNSDKCSDEIYHAFLEAYKSCEAIIPTRFDNMHELDSYEIKCRKRNFYCMWRLSEKIKIEFFNTMRVQFDLGNSDVKNLLVDSSNDYFYVNEDGYPKRKENPLRNVTITNKDVERVICGDIYGLIYGLMKDGNLTDDMQQNRRVENFDYYKLSGQSCKISLFKELLKEYIPGRKLRPYALKKGASSSNSENLKLECLIGCIKYIKDQRGHELTIRANAEKPRMIYNIFIKNVHTDDEKIFDCLNPEPEKAIYKIFAPNSDEMGFEIRNKDSVLERTFRLSLHDKNKLEPQNLDALISMIGKSFSYDAEYLDIIMRKMSEQLDTAENGAKVMFSIPSPDYYGAMIFVIQYINTEGERLYNLLSCNNIAFENADKTFFDGKR